MSEDWRDDPMTKGEMYDALMGAHARMKKATEVVDVSMEKLLKWHRPLLNLARCCVNVALSTPIEVAKKLSGEK